MCMIKTRIFEFHHLVLPSAVGLVGIFIRITEIKMLGKPFYKPNKTKYFRLRLSDEVGTEIPETDLRQT